MALVLGCHRSDATQATPTCADIDGEELPAGYLSKGKRLLADVDGDGGAERVELQVDAKRPAACRHVVVVELSAGDATAPVPPLPWPGTDPELLLLAELDGRPGRELVIAMSPLGVYQPGAVFTVHAGKLARMRLHGLRHGELFPLDDEFPAGVDCTGEPGRIVVTFGTLAERGADDRHWDITRSFYRAAGIRFELVRSARFRVEVGPGAERRWPELQGHAFRSCPGRVD